MPLSKQRYLIAIPKGTDAPSGLGVSDKPSLARSFPASPFGELGANANEVITKIFLEKVQGEGLGPNAPRERDETFWPNDADAPDPNYGKAPNLLEVRTDQPGDPSSPYAPNITSPTDGIDPKSQSTAAGVAVIESLVNSNIAGNGSPWQEKDGTNKPSQAAKIVSSQTLMNLQYGSSKPI